jgi:Zn-dependent M28 family amino/carboxypeptidase
MAGMGWLEITVATLLIIALLARVGIWMPGRSYRGPLPPLDPHGTAVCGRLRRHVEVLAGEIGERHVWNALAVDMQAFTVRGVEVRNVIGALGPDDDSAEHIVIGAHYDSVVGTVGANDNASGVAALIEVARAMATLAPRFPIRSVAFVNEEPPFFLTADMGSRRYARSLVERGIRVRAMLSLETLGCYTDRPLSQSYPIPLGLLYPRTGNFVAVVGNLRSRGLVRNCVRSFRTHTRFPCEGAALPAYLPGVFWSDHWAFWREGYPAAMVTDTALFRYGYYHLPGDTPEKLDYARLARVVTGLARVVADL